MQTCTWMCKSESWSELCSHCAALHCLSTMKFDLMQKLAKPAGSMHQTRQGLSLCMAVISMLGTAKGDEENWAFRFQRLTNVCRPRRHYFGQNFLFHQLVSSWLLQSLYTVLLRTMPSAVHKQGILFGLGSLP